MSAPTSPTVSGKLIAKLTESLCKGNGSRSEPDDSTLERAAEAAAEIEAELAKTFGSTKEYAAKGRSLCFNLGKNSSLRVSVLGGYFPAAALVNASTKELATRQQKESREAAQERFYAMRSIGDSERMVGWQAGTSGKLDGSYKYEEQALAKPAEGQAAATTAAAAAAAMEAAREGGAEAAARAGVAWAAAAEMVAED